MELNKLSSTFKNVPHPPLLNHNLKVESPGSKLNKGLTDPER